MPQDLPLYHLFQVLRNEGFSLGIEQYLLLIKALHQRKYLLDLGIIRRTCQTLWANSQEEILIFNRNFDLMMYTQKEALQKLEKEIEKKEKKQLEDKQRAKDETKANTKTPDKTEGKPKASLSEDDSKKQTYSISDTLPSQFIPFPTKGFEQYLMQTTVSPITLRQMQQSWRYLRKWKREGPRTEVDLKKTFEDIAQKGFFTETVKSAPRQNIVELLLLVDRNGSMLPFHGLLDDLIHSAIHGGRFTKARCLYFHDYPTKYLYRQAQLIEEIGLQELQRELNPKRTVVMVISDAGAARRTYSEKRVKRSKELQEYLKENTAAYVWLNPLPQERWEGCSAEDIHDFFPMFEINNEGLYQAIDVLRGKGKVIKNYSK